LTRYTKILDISHSFILHHSAAWNACIFCSTKDNYGSGYLLQLNLAQDNEQTIDSLLQFIKANIHPDAKIVTKQAKTVHINLPRDVNIQKIFTTLYSDGASKAMINQFLVSQSSLEDVFLALGE